MNMRRPYGLRISTLGPKFGKLCVSAQKEAQGERCLHSTSVCVLLSETKISLCARSRDPSKFFCRLTY